MIHKVKTFRISSSDTFFFDNNIWMYLYAPQKSNKRKEKEYGGFLEYIISRERPIYVSSLVLSEFANAYLRYSTDNWLAESQKDSRYKKDYVQTEDYNNAIIEIRAALKNILLFATKIPDNFTTIDIQSVMGMMEIANFNDSYYAQLCINHNCFVVSDDSDFFKLDTPEIKIITL